MYFAPPIDYDKYNEKVPYGKVIMVGKKYREHFAKLSGADLQSRLQRVYCFYCSVGELSAFRR